MLKEYGLGDGENINNLGKCKLDEAKKVAEKSAKKIKKTGLYNENRWLY